MSLHKKGLFKYFDSFCCKTLNAEQKKSVGSYKNCAIYVYSKVYFRRALLQICEEVISFIIGNNERWKISDRDFTYCFHSHIFKVD